MSAGAAAAAAAAEAEAEAAAAAAARGSDRGSGKGQQQQQQRWWHKLSAAHALLVMQEDDMAEFLKLRKSEEDGMRRAYDTFVGESHPVSRGRS